MTVDRAAKAAVSIAEFCAAHSICRATFYNLVKRGLAPVTLPVGRRRLISAEAAEAWRRRMEAASQGVA
jgi:predicted DNA-binding transcriptional regulator AlpA